MMNCECIFLIVNNLQLKVVIFLHERFLEAKIYILVLGNTIPTFSTWHKANSPQPIKLYYFCTILYQKDTERENSLIIQISILALGKRP